MPKPPSLQDIIANQVATSRDSRPGSRNYELYQKTGVPYSEEFKRIEQIPRRTWTREQAQELAVWLSEPLRQPGSTANLNPIQAVALWEMNRMGGLFAPIRVGGGKTLISFLAPWFLTAYRPVLLVPANLARKTDYERSVYSQMFQLPDNLYVQSYEKMSRTSALGFLNDYKPDALICDEGHRMRNPKAAVTRRVKRYLYENPGTKVVIMSGTITKRSIRDYATLIQWCLGSPPLPTIWSEIETWADALDCKVRTTKRVRPGALMRFADKEEADQDLLTAARKGYAKRLIDTPGVVATQETEVDASIDIHSEVLEPPEKVRECFDLLRTRWKRPDGWELADGKQVWALARQLACGFYIRWDPLPPAEWLEARSVWSKMVRDTLKRSSHLEIDTELQVINAIHNGTLQGDVAYAYEEWARIQHTFTPNKVSELVDTFVIDSAAAWGKKHKGLIWTEFPDIGNWIEELHGIPFYAQKGIHKATNKYVGSVKKGPVTLSIGANKEGRNLQHFNTNYVLTPPNSGDVWEQLIGRTHRPGQKEDSCDFKVKVACVEDLAAIWNSVKSSEYTKHSTMAGQKILDATIDVEDCSLRPGSPWQK